MTPEVLVGLLAEPARVRVFAAIVLGARSAAEVSAATSLGTREVAAALRRLHDGGIVDGVDGSLTARVEVFKEVARVRLPARSDEPLDEDRTRAAVLRAFISEGRLVSIPAVASKRRIVLEHIAATFEPGVRYPEREVNAALRAWYPDHAALRRYLIDEQLMARDRAVYWRIGGPVEL